MQHEAICEFPSKEFYEGRLQTDVSVMRRGDVLKLNTFWPQGERCPMVFCQVAGEEDGGHIGRSKVDSQSKFNKTEAEKIVSKHTPVYINHCMCTHAGVANPTFTYVVTTGTHSRDSCLSVQCFQRRNSCSDTILCSEGSDQR